MFCANCGKEVSEGTRFCSHCGKPIITVSEEKEMEYAGTSIANTETVVHGESLAIAPVQPVLLHGKCTEDDKKTIKFSVIMMAVGLVGLVLYIGIAMLVGYTRYQGSRKPDSDIVSDTKSEEFVDKKAEANVFSYRALDYVTLGDYSNLTVEVDKKDCTVDDTTLYDYVDQKIAEASRNAGGDHAKTYVEQGDEVLVDYEGKIDGAAFEGGSASDVWLDTDNTEAFVEGFMDNLVGAYIGDTVEQEVTFPDNYSNSELAGKKAIFTFQVKSVAEKLTHETVDDAFISDNFDAATLEELIDNSRKTLEKEAENNAKINGIGPAVLKVGEVSSFPEGLAEAIEEAQISYYKWYAGQNNISMEELADTYYSLSEEELLA